MKERTLSVIKLSESKRKEKALPTILRWKPAPHFCMKVRPMYFMNKIMDNTRCGDVEKGNIIAKEIQIY